MDQAQTTRVEPQLAAAPADPLRAACRRVLDAAGLSRARAAREIGISGATLSGWLTGNYAGDHAAVAARVRRWIDTRADLSRRSLAGAGLDRHVETGVAGEVAAALAYAQAGGSIALVTGPPGRGKTWAATRYCRDWSGATYLYATDAITTLAGLLRRVSAAVGAGEHPSALAAEDAIVRHLTDRGALLVVDEAHRLRAALLDELRALRDLSGSGLALVGDDSILMTLARCPQVLGRVGARVDLAAAVDLDAVAIAESVVGHPLGRAGRRVCQAQAAGPEGLHLVRGTLARAWLLSRAEEREVVTDDDLSQAAADLAGAA